MICEFAGDLARSENRINIGNLALPMANAHEDFDFAVPSLDGEQSDRQDQLDSSDQRFNHAKAEVRTATAWRKELDLPRRRRGRRPRKPRG